MSVVDCIVNVRVIKTLRKCKGILKILIQSSGIYCLHYRNFFLYDFLLLVSWRACMFQWLCNHWKLVSLEKSKTLHSCYFSGAATM